MFNPRRSRMLDKMRAGEKVISYKLNFSCPHAAELAAISGFDAIWICQEHVPMDFSAMSAQIMAAKCHDCDTIVRVAKGSYSDYIRPLEADATGIMIPHLMSLEEAREIAHTVRFHPIGRRPVDGGNADGMYCKLPFKDYIKFMNDNRIIIVQIEDPEPLSELDKICQVPGIDMIFFGPGDFSHAIGHPAEFDHPEVVRTRKLIVETAHKYGKFVGTVSVPSMKQCFAEGFDYVNCGSDVSSIGSTCAKIMDDFKEIVK